MRKLIGLTLLAALVAAPASAQGKKVTVSVGYAFSHYLEEGGGNVPVGAYLSIASSGNVGLEADVAYHRDSEKYDGETWVLNTITAGVGPRFAVGSAKSRPFLHVLGGVRYDSSEGDSNTALGGMAGVGVDIAIGAGVFLRLGADYQMFFDEGENLKTLRLSAGISF